MKAYSIHNSILAQVREEDTKLWSISPSYMPPTPAYKKVRIPFRPANVVAFITNFLLSLRP